MNAAKPLPPTFDALITAELITKPDQASPGGKQSNAPEPSGDIVAAGAISVAEIEKLMEEFGSARDYLKAEGERVRRINARYAHLTSTASASVKIIAESMGKWRTSELEKGIESDAEVTRLHGGKLPHAAKL